MDKHGNFYATTRYAAGVFNHASFFDGGEVADAGQWIVRRGDIRNMIPRSGHYLTPTAFHQQGYDELQRNGVAIHRHVFDCGELVGVALEF